MVKVNVENLRRDLSANLDVTSEMPNPCMNNPIEPTYERTIPVLSASNPNCSMAITEGQLIKIIQG